MTSWPHTDLTRRLDLRYPIVLGPFGGVSSATLVAAVSEGGGLGSFGLYGFSAERIAAAAAEIRALTSRPFALNVWVPYDGSEQVQPTPAELAGYLEPLQPYLDELGLDAPELPEQFLPTHDEQVEAVLAARPAALSFVFGVPAADVLERCRSLGITTFGTATTVDEAVALDRAGVDVVVATGAEAGGHRVSFLRPARESLVGTFALVPQVVDAVEVPVVAAGGIADGRGVAAAMILGAQGVQVGTAFLACAESAANPAYRETLFSEQARHTVLTRSFSGRLARGVPNRFTRDLDQRTPAPFPVQNWLTGRIRAAAIQRQDTGLMSLWAGQSAGLVRHRDAQSLLDSLVGEASQLLGGGPTYTDRP